MGESLWKGKVNFFIVAQCLIYWQVNFQEIPSGKTWSRVKWRQASSCKGGQPETWVETLSQRLNPGKEICRHTLVGRQISVKSSLSQTQFLPWKQQCDAESALLMHFLPQSKSKSWRCRRCRSAASMGLSCQPGSYLQNYKIGHFIEVTAHTWCIISFIYGNLNLFTGNCCCALD